MKKLSNKEWWDAFIDEDYVKGIEDSIVCELKEERRLDLVRKAIRTGKRFGEIYAFLRAIEVYRDCIYELERAGEVTEDASQKLYDLQDELFEEMESHVKGDK